MIAAVPLVRGCILGVRRTNVDYPVVVAGEEEGAGAAEPGAPTGDVYPPPAEETPRRPGPAARQAEGDHQDPETSGTVYPLNGRALGLYSKYSTFLFARRTVTCGLS